MKSPRGSIRQRGRESWELAVRINRHRVTRTIHATTREEAEDALLDLRRELRDEGVPDRDPTVAELVEEWLAVVRGRVKERTARRYAELLRLHVVPEIGGVRVRSLRPGDVERVKAKALASRSSRTALHVYRVLAELLAEAERWGIGPNVAKAVRPPRPGRPQLTVPTAEETRRILEAVKRLHRRGASHPRSWLRSPAWRGSRAQVGGGRCREGEDPHHRDDVPRGTNRAED